MTTLSLDHFLPSGREASDVGAALEVAGATRIALVAACVTIEDHRLTSEACGDAEGARLTAEAAARLKARAVTIWNTIAALKALDPTWTAERDKALDTRLEAMAADATNGRWMLDMAADFLKIALSEVRLSAMEAAASQVAEVADAG